MSEQTSRGDIRLVHDQTTGILPTSTYKLFAGQHEVGFFQLRHKPGASADVPSKFASHIYYEVYPQFRGRRYGTTICRLALREAAKIGLKQIIATCYEDNLASRKIIERVGGVLADSTNDTPHGKEFLKFTIAVVAHNGI